MIRNIFTRRFTLILPLLAVAASLLSASAFAQPPGNSLAGFWLVEATPDAASGVPTLHDNSAFTKDGQIITSSESGTGVGGWERLTGHEYAITFANFLPGLLRAVVFSTVTLDMGGQHFSGPFRTEVRDLEGNLVFGFEGTVSGLRQAVEPY